MDKRTVTIVLATAISAMSVFAAGTEAPSGAAPIPPSSGDEASSNTSRPLREMGVSRLDRGRRASLMVGSEVRNDADELIGTVDDLLINGSDKVVYAVLSVGGFLGIGDHLIVIPYEALTYNRDGQAVLAGATKEQLRQMPRFRYSSEG